MDLAIPGIFSAGVLTFFTPCVLPLIPIYLSALLGGNIRDVNLSNRGLLLVRSLFFSAGFILVFSLMGLGAASIGSFLQENKGAVQLGGALLILIFGLKFLNVLHIPALDKILKADERKVALKGGAINAFIMGVVFAAGWSPCVGPVLGSVLTYAAAKTSDMFTGVLYLATYGVGFALPLFGVAFFAEAGVKFIRGASRFLPAFEKAIGALLIITSMGLLLDLVSGAGGVSESKESEAIPSAEMLVEPGEFPILIEFYSKDCPVCERMKPIMDDLFDECNNKLVEIRAIDISKPSNRSLATQFRLLGVPTFVFLNNQGEEVARLIGEQTKEQLKQAISALRGEPCPGVSYIPKNFLQMIDGTQNAACDGDSSSASTAECGG